MFKKVFNINFFTNGGKAIESIQCKYKDNIPELTVPEKDGYNFKGWFLEETLENEFNLETMPKNDINLYAKWEAISLEEFLKDINFFTKSSNILQNLQNDYSNVPDFKDVDESKPVKKTTKKKTSTKKTTTKKKTTAKKSTTKKTTSKPKEVKEVSEVVENKENEETEANGEE